MSDASGRFAAHELDIVWADFIGQSYALTHDTAIGLPEKFRTNFHQTYFNDFTICHDDGDLPVDRKRARDVIRYRWREDHLDLREHDTITITDRAGIVGQRNHRRVELLGDPEAAKMVQALLSLVPPVRRQNEGTLGVNLFRTFTDVVTRPHRDYEQFVILYVLDRVGEGGESYLYNAAEETPPTGRSVLRHQLDPGEILIFDDERFVHGATPLIAPPAETARRDVVICTVDYHETYLGTSAPDFMPASTSDG
jgi:hypothetical protein